jgi:hypothetical protein
MHHQKKIKSFISAFLFVVLAIVSSSCISDYVSDIEDEPDLISIECSLIKGEPEQTVRVSVTASLEHSRFMPVGGCNVTLLDDHDNEYQYSEAMIGIYKASVPDENMVDGRHYKIRVITGEGDVYESDYERLNAGVEVDTIYYAIEDKADAITGEPFSGIQFYLDVKATEDESRYFRWKLEETYEYTSLGPISYYYLNAALEPVFPYDSWSKFRCWKRDDVEGLFQSSTMNLTLNEKKKISLNYVSDQTERLGIKYSLLVEQYTLSENAYNYFEQNRIATEESGGLYTQQPRQPITNFRNVLSETERVLGYFWVSTKTSQRIFVSAIEEIEAKGEPCSYWEFSVEDDGGGPFPIYIFDDKDAGKKLISTLDCIDCTRRGGSNQRPDYWE